MQRSTYPREDPWDKPQPARDRSDQPMMARYPLPTPNSNRRLPPRHHSADSHNRPVGRRSMTAADFPALYSDFNITSQQYQNAKAVANSHRRQRHMRFQVSSSMSPSSKKGDEACEPEITNPMGESFSSFDYRSVSNLTKATQSTTPMDDSSYSIREIPRHRHSISLTTGTRSLARALSRSFDYSSGPEITNPMGESFSVYDEDYNSVPRNLDLSSSFKSKDVSCMDDDDDFLSQSQSYWSGGRNGDEASVDNYNNNNNNTTTTAPRVPHALDKTSVKRLAAQHRASLTSNRSRASAESLARRIREQVALEEDYDDDDDDDNVPDYHSNHRRARSASPPHQARPMVEICPGLSAPLRGSDEARKAVASRFYRDVTCFGCSSNIHCVADALYTLCPLCRVISPLDSYEGDERMERWGLGLGFTRESLWDMEDQLAASANHYPDERY